MIGVVFGAETVSISLLGFGSNSWVEVLSACMVCWRFYNDVQNIIHTPPKNNGMKKERTATTVIGVLLIVLPLCILSAGIIAITLHQTPEDNDLPNIIISSITILIMILLYLTKLRIAYAVPSSPTIAADAQCSLCCIQLSFVLLIGSVIDHTSGNEVW